MYPLGSVKIDRIFIETLLCSRKRFYLPSSGVRGLSYRAIRENVIVPLPYSFPDIDFSSRDADVSSRISMVSKYDWYTPQKANLPSFRGYRLKYSIIHGIRIFLSTIHIPGFQRRNSIVSVMKSPVSKHRVSHLKPKIGISSMALTPEQFSTLYSKLP